MSNLWKIWNAKFQELINEGTDEEEAFQSADDYVKDLMAEKAEFELNKIFKEDV